MKIEDIKIYIVEYDVHKAHIIKKYFAGIKNIQIINSSLESFFEIHKNEIDTIISPGNAYGIMTGGFDRAISNILGFDFQKKVQAYIRENYYGEQLVGSSFVIDTNFPSLKLIHTPTMILPSFIKDPNVIYTCTRSSFICALENKCKCLILPLFGGSCGNVDPSIASKKMLDAYMQIKNHTKD